MSEPVPVNAHSFERDVNNFYVEPSWVTTRLCEAEEFEGLTVDPCAGGGNILKGAKAAGLQMYGTDLIDRGFQGVQGNNDFFAEGRPGQWPVANIIANPPYGPWPDKSPGLRRIEERFIELALTRVHRKVAVFLDAGWDNASKRGAWLETLPLYRIYKVGPRPSCPPGDLYYSGNSKGNAKTDYSWFVFLRGYRGPPTTHRLRRDN